MDGLREFLEDLRQKGLVRGRFLGVLNVAIGRRIARSDGTILSAGVTWRELAALFKRIRWDVELVRELGLDPADLPPRDRQRFWYTAITHAQVSSAAARAAGDALAAALAEVGYAVGPAPGGAG
jgi:hypothetical protein